MAAPSTVTTHGYQFKEYEDTMKRIEDALQPVMKVKKGGKVTSTDLKDKLGDKMNMASVIMTLTNTCLVAKELLRKMHGHNFELRGKVADLSTVAVKKLTTEMDKNTTEIMDAIKQNVSVVDVHGENIVKRSFAEMVGENKEALVFPMKQAMKQIKEDDGRKNNIVITGLDLNPAISDDDKQKKQLMKVAKECIIEADLKDSTDVNKIAILGKIEGQNAGKAPPVLVTLKSPEAVKRVLQGASRLSKIEGFRRVYIAPDLSPIEREKRKKIVDDMKRKIAEFPEQYWFIRNGAVSSKGNFTPRPRLDSEDGGKDMDKSFNY